jgi:hypothetical protein
MRRPGAHDGQALKGRQVVTQWSSVADVALRNCQTNHDVLQGMPASWQVKLLQLSSMHAQPEHIPQPAVVPAQPAMHHQVTTSNSSSSKPSPGPRASTRSLQHMPPTVAAAACRCTTAV